MVLDKVRMHGKWKADLSKGNAAMEDSTVGWNSWQVSMVLAENLQTATASVLRGYISIHASNLRHDWARKARKTENYSIIFLSDHLNFKVSSSKP